MSSLNSIINWENLTERELLRAQLDIAKELLRRRGPINDFEVYNGMRVDSQERLATSDIDRYIRTKPINNTNEYIVETEVQKRNTRPLKRSEQEESPVTSYYRGPINEVITETVYAPTPVSQPRSRQVKTTTYTLPPNTSIMPTTEEVVTVTSPSRQVMSPVYRVKRNE